ncbi:MAG: Ger(x)C family spore germination protein [Clostridia bacterium]|nr:Ger(x)C family spore germination protein [Clostridia bacterium]
MNRKAIILLIAVLSTFLTSGCWNYRGLNEMAIVSGLAIDKGEDARGYKLSFEILDLGGSSKEGGVKTKFVESTGNTIFDAIRNAKKKTESKLYFGNARIIILNDKLARDEDISQLMDVFLRANEVRETTNVVIAKNMSAGKAISSKTLTNAITSFELQKIIAEDNKNTASTMDNQLYKIYNILKAPGESLVLPAISEVQNGKEPVLEIDGLAVFNGERLAGYLTPEESKYYLFAANAIKGGLLTLSVENQNADSLSLEIVKNKTKVKNVYDGERIKLIIQTETDAYLNELAENINVLDEKQINEVCLKEEEKLSYLISSTIKKVQNDYKTDIFGFGNKIYKHNTKLWQQVGSDWDEFFGSAEIEVKSKINILNTDSIKKL